MSLLEVPIPGMQLLCHLLLSDITPGDNFSKANEGKLFFFLLDSFILQLELTTFSDVKLKAVRVMITYLNSVWGSSNPSVEIINEVTKGNPLLQLLANIILETLGIFCTSTRNFIRSRRCRSNFAFRRTSSSDSDSI